MEITFQSEGVEPPQIDETKLTTWIEQIANKHKKRAGEISFLFCSDEKIIKINKEYLHHNYYTDIITFDYSEHPIVSGDILISLDTVKTNSLEYNTTFLDELHRVIIHGILHLCELNDHEDEDKVRMRKAEDEALQILALL